MKIGKYISELLFEHDFVILPELGEFSTKYIPAKFIPELKKVQSPSKVITFNDKNKSGGGLLIEYIAKKENVDAGKAKEFVSSFVSEMQNSLKSGKKVELESIGKFSMDQGGNILFEADTNINYLKDSAGMSAVKEPAKKSPEAAKTELDKVIEESTSKPPEPAKDAPKEKAAAASTPVGSPTAAKPSIEPPKPGAAAAQQTKTPLAEPPKKEVPPKVEKHPAPKEKGKAALPPALMWVAFTVVPLLIIIIIIAFNYEYIFGSKSLFFGKDKQVQQVERTHTPTETDQYAEETATYEEETFDPTVAPPAPETGRPVFYIIVGSFEEEHSAVILAEELRGKDARTASVFPANRAGFYRVSYGYYYDLSEAERMLTEAKSINPDAWILHR